MTKYLAYIRSLLFQRNLDGNGVSPRIHAENTPADVLYGLFQNGEPDRQHVEQAIEDLVQHTINHPGLRQENLPLFRLVEDLMDRRRDVTDEPLAPEEEYSGPEEAPCIPGQNGKEFTVEDVKRFYGEFNRLMEQHGYNMKNLAQSCLLMINNQSLETDGVDLASYAFAQYDAKTNTYANPIPAPTPEEYQAATRKPGPSVSKKIADFNQAYEQGMREWLQENTVMPPVDFDDPEVTRTHGYKIFANMAKAAAEGRLFLNTGDHKTSSRVNFGTDGCYVTYSKNGNLLLTPNMNDIKHGFIQFLGVNKDYARKVQEALKKRNGTEADLKELGYTPEFRNTVSEDMRHFNEEKLTGQFERYAQGFGYEQTTEPYRGAALLKETSTAKEALTMDANTVQKVLCFADSLHLAGIDYPRDRFKDIPKNKLAFDEEFIRVSNLYRQARNGEVCMGEDLLSVNEFGDAVLVEKFRDRLKDPKEIEEFIRSTEAETDPEKKRVGQEQIKRWLKEIARIEMPSFSLEEQAKLDAPFDREPQPVAEPGLWAWIILILSFGLARGPFDRYQQYLADSENYPQEKKRFDREHKALAEKRNQFDSVCRDICLEVYDCVEFSELEKFTTPRFVMENPAPLKEVDPSFRRMDESARKTVADEKRALQEKRRRERSELKNCSQREQRAENFRREGCDYLPVFPSCTDVFFQSADSLDELVAMRNQNKPFGKDRLTEMLTDIILRCKVVECINEDNTFRTKDLDSNDQFISRRLDLEAARQEISHNISVKNGLADQIIKNPKIMDASFLHHPKDSGKLYDSAVAMMAKDPQMTKELQQKVFPAVRQDTQQKVCPIVRQDTQQKVCPIVRQDTQQKVFSAVRQDTQEKVSAPAAEKAEAADRAPIME